MRHWRLLFALLAVASLAAFCATPASAVITFDLNTVFSGATPDGSPPWLTATFQNNGANTVRLTLTSHLSDDNFVGGGIGQFGWGFNYSGDPTTLGFAFVSGNDANSIIAGTNAFKADGDGSFDILFGWDDPPSSRFGGIDTAVYDITAPGLVEGNFNLTSNTEPGNGTTWHSAAHVQGIGTSGEDSSFIGDGPAIPEPVSLVIWSVMGLGGIGVALIRRRRALHA